MTTHESSDEELEGWLHKPAAALLSIRWVQQSLALTCKNLLVAWRNRRSTLLRMLAPLVFLLLALLIQLALDANSRRQAHIRETDTTSAQPINNIPPCNADLFIGSRPCVNFLYSPNTSTLVKGIIDNIRTRNTPEIAEAQVLGFSSRVDAEDWMMAHPESTLGAVHFRVDEAASPPVVQYTLQTNTTAKSFKGESQSPVTFFTLPLASAVAREISRVQLAAARGGSNSSSQPLVEDVLLEWSPQLVKFPHPQLRSIGMVGYVLGPFIFAACMFGMVMQLGAVVTEKEVGLLAALRLMGLRQSAYWSSWVAADLLLGLATALSIVIWGLVLQFRFFLRNDVSLLLLLFWLFTLALSSFSYCLSVFINRAQTATYTGFAVFLAGWICQTVVVFGVPYEPDTYFAPSGVGRAFFWVFALLPWCPLSKATMDLAAATNTDKSPGLRWCQRESYCQYIPDAALRPPVDPTATFVDFDCLFPISQCYTALILQALGWLLLAVYLDNVLPGPNKRARPPWYFLLPSYWVKRRGVRCGLSARQQQQLLQQANAAAGGLRHQSGQQSGEGSSNNNNNNNNNSSGGGRSRPKQPASLHGSMVAWGNMGGVSSQQQQGGDARLDLSGSGGSGSHGGIDDDVAAEEAAMQALLPLLMPAAAAAAGRRVSGSAGGDAPGSLPSWPHFQPDAEADRTGVMMSSQHTQADDHTGTTTHTTNSSGSRNPVSGSFDFCGYAVAVIGLSKVFKGGSCGGGLLCCGRRRAGGAGAGSGAKAVHTGCGSSSSSKDFQALSGVWLSIRPGQLFALLGPNGAGKTTAIGCLTGLLAPSSGELLVCGESILTEGGLDRVTGLIGVCPQFDVLWAELTGREHLLVAAAVKGLQHSQVAAAADRLLARVQLSGGASSVRSSAYSGGMKRRLSVALALVGDPQVLFLDEPTTGMDPISRRAVWDVIQEAKQGRAVVLTTHSMEEADVLADRIGILARGRLRALGSSIRLKQKFGTGYEVDVTLLDPRSTGSVTTQQQQQHNNSSSSSKGLRQRHKGQEQQQRQQKPTGQSVELTPRNVVLGGQVSTGELAARQPLSLSDATMLEQGSSSSGSGIVQSAGGSSQCSIAMEASEPPSQQGSPRRAAAAASAAAATMSAAKAAVRALFAAHLGGLTPAEDNRHSLRYLVPRHQQQQLVGLLQELEAAMAGSSNSSSGSSAGGAGGGSSGVGGGGVSEQGLRLLQQGVADVQLRLTSLEEVFLSIAKQAEVEAAAVTGQTVSITLPDTGRELKVPVGQDWVMVDGVGGEAAQEYRVKWVQDEYGALAVLEVVRECGSHVSSAAAAVAPVTS